MISVQEAREIIARHHRVMKTKKVLLEESLGKVLANDLFAPFALPHFMQSSVDGYALSFGENKSRNFLIVEGESSAGMPSNIILKPGQAMRVFTGASVPPGTDAVVMQEKTSKDKLQLMITDDLPGKDMNIRKPGSDILQNELAIKKGVRINPAKIGLLASFGIKEVEVFETPSVSMLITGNEFITPDESLRDGLIYESNSYILEAGLRQLGVADIKKEVVRDDAGAILEALKNALLTSDIVLITGGVSVGDYDYTVRSAKEAGVKQLFHKIAQRPGKPMYFGMKKDVFVFGLPGNMSSVLTCFYMYISPLISFMQQLPDPVTKIKTVLAEEVKSPEGLTSFLKGFYQDGHVKPLTGQESYKLKSYADANCLIEIPAHLTGINSESSVDIHLIPNC